MEGSRAPRVALPHASAMAQQQHTNRCWRDASTVGQRRSICMGQWDNVQPPSSQNAVCLWRGMNSVAPAHTKHPKCEWQPAVQRHVVCRSQRTSTPQHREGLFSGTIGAFRLCSDKRLDQLQIYREQSVKLTPCLFLSGNGTGTAGSVTEIPQLCQACSSKVLPPMSAPLATPFSPSLLGGKGGVGQSSLFCKLAVRLC